MFPEESGDLEALLLRRLRLRATMGIEAAMRSLGGRRNLRSPRRSGLYGAARGSVLGGRIGGLIASALGLGTEVEADVGGQPLEQRAGIAGLGLLSFCAAE